MTNPNNGDEDTIVITVRGQRARDLLDKLLEQDDDPDEELEEGLGDDDERY
jgi:hypothetical protein